MTDANSEKQQDNPPGFEQSVERLERIIERIESGEVGLEDALKEYEQGMELLKHCRGILDRAERKIEQLTVDAQGELQSGEHEEQQPSAASDASPEASEAPSAPEDEEEMPF